MQINDFEMNLLKMMKKFGPAASCSNVAKRETALQELVKFDYATMTRNDKGTIKYSITNAGRAFLDEHLTNRK